VRNFSRRSVHGTAAGVGWEFDLSSRGLRPRRSNWEDMGAEGVDVEEEEDVELLDGVLPEVVEEVVEEGVCVVEDALASGEVVGICR